MTSLVLFRSRLVGERWRLPLWIGGIALLTAVSSASVLGQFSQPEEQRILLVAAAANPAFRFLRGLPIGLGTGELVFFQIFTYLALLAGLMSTFLVVRHTRGDEDQGRTELIAATPVRRTAPLGTALGIAVLANAVLGAAVTLALALPGLPWRGSLLTGLAVAACGCVFAAIAALAAQAMPTSRGANAAAAGAVGLAYLLRGIGDALAEPDVTFTGTTKGSWPSWLSPIGWGQQIEAYRTDDPVPLLWSSAAAVLLAALALAVAARRDLGASLLPERRGRERALPVLLSPLGLAWRLHWPSLAGWVAGAVVLGALAGYLAPTIADAVGTNPQFHQLMSRLIPGARAGLLDLFVAAILGVAGFLAAAAGAQAVMRLRAEEAEGRAELLMSAPVSRARWMLAHLLVAVASVAAVLLPTGAVTALTFAAVGVPDRAGSSLAAGLAQAPAALVFVGLVALVFAILPGLTVPLGWSLLALSLIVGEYGQLLQLPDWVQQLSPFRHTSAMPAQDLDVGGVLVLLAVAVASGVLGILLIRRRDLPA